jgi:hypothetical protein
MVAIPFSLISRWIGRRSVGPGHTDLIGRGTVRDTGSCCAFPEQGPHAGDVVLGY